MMKTKNILAVFIALALLSFSVLTVIASQIEDKLTSGMDTSEMTGGAATSPTASPAAGDYSSTQTVTLTATGATTICYTIDGNDATCASSDACEAGASVYTTALSISDDTTINTTACYPENTPSNLASLLIQLVLLHLLPVEAVVILRQLPLQLLFLQQLQPLQYL